LPVNGLLDRFGGSAGLNSCIDLDLEEGFMRRKELVGSVGRGLLYGAGLAAGVYAAYAGTTWLRYGHVREVTDGDRDPLLDAFMPAYEVVERHRIRVEAPADITFAAACGVDFQQSAVIRAIFKGREVMLGSAPDAIERPRGLLDLTKSLGWGVLAEIPGHEVVMGAVTQPWQANVVFRPVPSDKFAGFNDPDYVKIAWTLRADPLGDHQSMARTETRVMTTDPQARRKFRRYWSLVSPGIVMIRRVAMTLVRAEAERRFRATPTASPDRFDPVSARMSR
jgi:hypothetical protein